MRIHGWTHDKVRKIKYLTKISRAAKEWRYSWTQSMLLAHGAHVLVTTPSLKPSNITIFTRAIPFFLRPTCRIIFNIISAKNHQNDINKWLSDSEIEVQSKIEGDLGYSYMYNVLGCPCNFQQLLM